MNTNMKVEVKKKGKGAEELGEKKGSKKSARGREEMLISLPIDKELMIGGRNQIIIVSITINNNSDNKITKNEAVRKANRKGKA